MPFYFSRSILFLKDYGREKKRFLLILTNAYLRKKTLDNYQQLENLNRELLFAYFIRKHELIYNISAPGT